jgi:hypothetical protein
MVRSIPGTAGERGTADLIPDNGQVERMNRTIKNATASRVRARRNALVAQLLADPEYQSSSA